MGEVGRSYNCRYVRYGVDKGRVHLFDVPEMNQATSLDALNEVYSGLGLVDPRKSTTLYGDRTWHSKLNLYRVS